MSGAMDQAHLGAAAPAPTAAEAELAVQARQAPGRSRGYWAGVWRRLRRDPVTIACALVLLLMLLAIVSAPLIAPHDPYAGSMVRRLRPIGTPGHPLGTDELGRDILTRLLHGGRLSWFMGILPVVMAFGAPSADLVAWIVGLNATLGVAFGYLYMHRGIEAAMLAHAAAHVPLQVMVSLVG